MQTSRFRLIAAVLTIMIALFIRAGLAEDRPAVPPPADAKVEQLIKDLSADDSKQRDKAREQLIARGEEVVPRIRALAADSQEPELRTSAQAILAAIQAAGQLGPSLITLDVKDAPVKDVIEAIAKQAKVELHPWPDSLWNDARLNPVTLSVKRQPFWAVMKDLLPRVGLQLMEHGPDEGLHISQGMADMAGPSHISGPFMVIATGASESRMIRYAALENLPQTSCNIGLMVYVEPKLRLLARDYQPTIDEFVDDAGHSLLTPRRVVSHFMDTNSRSASFRLNVDVPPVPGRSKRVARLKGSIAAMILVRSELIEIPDILNAKGASQAKSGRRLVINDVTGGGNGQYTVNATLFMEPQPPGVQQPQWQRNVSTDGLKLLDAEGKELNKQGHSASGDGQKWQLEMRFARRGNEEVGEPVKLTWEFPIEGKPISILFEFKDLALP
jgi:hypothetical protein